MSSLRGGSNADHLLLCSKASLSRLSVSVVQCQHQNLISACWVLTKTNCRCLWGAPLRGMQPS